ncbi:hypothetical protein ACIRN4_23575 [Pimelobacter simplex]|uniref:hypothetical protein n=1 Tax=Nocardioides simplex TaxID=2045 RepID=UPI00382B79B9
MLLTFLAAVPPPAQATTAATGHTTAVADRASSTWKATAYNRRSTWHIKGFGCVNVTFAGTASTRHAVYRHNIPRTGVRTTYESYGPQISAPRARVVLTAGKCTSTTSSRYVNAAKVSIQQTFSNTTCSANWSIGASAPFAVSVGATPSCSSTHVLTRRTTYGRGHDFAQRNSSTVGIFKHTATKSAYNTRTLTFPTLCAKAAVTVTVYYARSGRQVSNTKQLDQGSVCS